MSDGTKTILLYEPIAEEGKSQDVLARRPPSLDNKVIGLLNNTKDLVDTLLDEVKNLIAGAQLFLGNDSGPAHIAAAFGVPVAVIFGASNPSTWAPWRTESRVLIAPGSIEQITVDQVIEATASLLQHRVSI